MCVSQVEEEEGQLVLDRNPLEWSVDEVVQFISSTDCASLATIFQEQVHTLTHTHLKIFFCSLVVLYDFITKT